MKMVIAQPIAGVSIVRETELESVYPSVASLGVGRLIGTLMQAPASISSATIRIGIQFLLGCLLAPVSAVAYGAGKVVRNNYVITNRSVVVKAILGSKRKSEVPLAEISDIQITSRPGYEFHHAGDLILKNRDGKTLLEMVAIIHPGRVKNVLLETQAAHAQAVQAQAVIQAREVPA